MDEKEKLIDEQRDELERLLDERNPQGLKKLLENETPLISSRKCPQML